LQNRVGSVVRSSQDALAELADPINLPSNLILEEALLGGGQPMESCDLPARKPD